MKRDMDLVRKLLIHIEENCDSRGLHSPSIEIQGYSEDEIGYNVQIMYNGELLNAIDSTSMGDKWGYYLIRGLTWDGHEFIDSIRNDNVWSHTKEALKPVGTASLTIVMGLATAYAKQLVGLP